MKKEFEKFSYRCDSCFDEIVGEFRKNFRWSLDIVWGLTNDIFENCGGDSQRFYWKNPNSENAISGAIEISKSEEGSAIIRYAILRDSEKRERYGKFNEKIR